MAFTIAGSLSPFGGPLLRSQIVANSVALVELDSVTVEPGYNAAGFVRLGVAAGRVFGHVKAIVTNNGVGLLTDGTTGAAIGSFTNAYTVASDNQTIAQVRAQVDVSKETLYSVDPDAAIATTTGSNLLGYKTDIIDEDNTDEDTATSATAQYFIWGVDPNTAANQIVNIFESGVFGV